MTGSHSSTVEDDSPPNSLLMQADLWVPTEAELQAAPETPRPASSATRERSTSSAPMLHKIVNLFAGRKKLPKVEKDQKISHSEPSPTSTNNTGQAGFEEPSAPPPPPPPRLTHQQVIPGILVPGADYCTHLPAYKKIRPAPEHRYTGFGTVAQDTYKPTVVQRGFHVGNNLTPTSFADRRNNSTGRLLDRDGNTWASWHEKNSSPEHPPFARKSSVEENAHHQ